MLPHLFKEAKSKRDILERKMILLYFMFKGGDIEGTSYQMGTVAFRLDYLHWRSFRGMMNSLDRQGRYFNLRTMPGSSEGPWSEDTKKRFRGIIELREIVESGRRPARVPKTLLERMDPDVLEHIVGMELIMPIDDHPFGWRGKMWVVDPSSRLLEPGEDSEY